MDCELIMAIRFGSTNLRSVWGINCWSSCSLTCLSLFAVFCGLVISLPASRSIVLDRLAFLRTCCFFGMVRLGCVGITAWVVEWIRFEGTGAWPKSDGRVYC